MLNRNRNIERGTLLALLDQWRNGVIDERDVHEQVEAMVEQCVELPEYDKNDPGSIAVEIIIHLDALNHQLITADDIPAMEAFLQTPRGEELQGWANWKNYWESLDIEKRRKELRDNPYYCT